MRSQKQVEAEIEEMKEKIRAAQELQVIGTFDGADRLVAFFERTKAFYVNSMLSMNHNAPDLNTEYAQRKACLTLVQGVLDGVNNAEENLGSLKQRFLDLNEELGKVMEEQERRERNKM